MLVSLSFVKQRRRTSLDIWSIVFSRPVLVGEVKTTEITTETKEWILVSFEVVSRAKLTFSYSWTFIGFPFPWFIQELDKRSSYDGSEGN